MRCVERYPIVAVVVGECVDRSCHKVLQAGSSFEVASDNGRHVKAWQLRRLKMRSPPAALLTYYLLNKQP